MMTYDSNGFLARVTNPNNETYSIQNAANGFMLSFQKPMEQQSQVTYSAGGFVLEDLGAGGNLLGLSRQFDSATQTQIIGILKRGRVVTGPSRPFSCDKNSHPISAEMRAAISTC